MIVNKVEDKRISFCFQCSPTLTDYKVFSHPKTTRIRAKRIRENQAKVDYKQSIRSNPRATQSLKRYPRSPKVPKSTGKAGQKFEKR